jgi:hypothetical protein
MTPEPEVQPSEDIVRKIQKLPPGNRRQQQPGGSRLGHVDGAAYAGAL